MSYSECNIGAVCPYEISMGGFRSRYQSFYDDPHAFQIDSFCIFGNLYYVGDKKVCMHLIDTGDGLILIDTGYGNTLDMILESIITLGFSPEDIRYIIHTHGHFDHFGSTDALRQRYGCKVFMSKVDTELIRERPERALCHLGPDPNMPICWPDVEIEDGDCITLGNTSIRCQLAPGHTMGTLALFFDVTDGQTVKRAGLWGGVGFLTIYKEYCREMGLPETKCALMAQSIRQLWDEPVDIMLGNHPGQNCTLEKRQYALENPGSNPFINPHAWRIFLTELEAGRKEFEDMGY